MGAEKLGAFGLPSADWMSSASPMFNAAGEVFSPKPAGPSRAESSMKQTSAFDNSGFVVNTGSGKASSITGFQLSPWEAVGLAALALLVWLKLNKKK